MRAPHFTAALALALALLAPPLSAQRAKLLPAEQVSSGGNYSEQARAADMTGDGVLDIVAIRNLNSTGFEQPGLVILRGLQGGSDAGRFVVHSFKSTPRQPWFAIADLDGDGRLDVVSSRPPIDGAINIAPSVQVFRGTPAGTLLDPLASPISAVVGEQAGDLRLADFDEDGELDVAILAGKPGIPYVLRIRVGLGHGDGTFGSFTSETLARYALAATDVDGDGHADLVSGDGPVTLLGHGDGSFAPGVSGPEPGVHTHIAVGDLDGTGSLDFVGVGWSYSGVDARPGQPGGAFGSPSNLLLAAGAFPSDVAVRDFDADGLGDIVASLSWGDYAQPQTGSLVSWRGQGGFAFAPEEQLPVGSSPNSLDFADLDGDGLQDVLFGHQSFYGTGTDPTNGAVPGVAILFRRVAPSPGLTLGQAFGGGSSYLLPDRALGLAGGDVDGDGRLDAIALLEHQAVAVLLGDGAGGLQPATLAALPGLQALAFEPRRVQLGDLDGDGSDDLLIAGVGSAGHLAALSLGDGVQFSAPVLFGAGDANDELLLDANADGTLDLVAARPLQNLLDVHLGAGDGSFSAALPTPVAEGPRVLATADLDADGLPDLAVSSGGTPQLALLLGAGAGAFHAPSWLAAPEAPTSVSFFDLDADDRPELVTLSNGAELDVRAGLGGLAFGPPQPAPLLSHGTVLRSGDLDRDGRADLLALLPGRDAIAFLGGDGAGGLLPAVLFSAGFSPRGALLADLDADGFPDLVSLGQQHASHDAIYVQLGQSGPITDLGYAHGGAAGTPKLTGTGTPAPGQPVSFTASGASGVIAGFLFAGLDSVHLPFKGGMLVPLPSISLPLLPNAPLSGPWPALTPGSAAYLQAWFATGSGIVATNALVVVTE